MDEFWIISAPGENTPQQTWERLNAATGGQTSNGISKNYKFQIPDLKVGTLDSLIGLSDDLGKIDLFAEGVCKKVASYMAEVLEDQADTLSSNLKAGEKTLTEYLHHFQWNMAKYPVKQSLRTLSEIISKVLTQVDTDLRSKSHAYNNLKSNLQNMERKASGSLLMRNLNQVVQKDDFIHDSEYLQTILVAVPIYLTNDWINKYETLTEYVAPRSTRFFVREFQYNEREMSSDQDQINKLASDKKKMLGPLLRWLKVNFSEAFIAWMHLKALRVFVESVLRYGLPVNFQAMVLQPMRKQQKRLRDTLNNLYGDLDGTGLTQAEEDALPGLTLGMQEYYPYVFYRVLLDYEPRTI